jgi:hypothetical protein
MKCTLYACPQFWSDVKETKKSASKKSLFETSLDEEQFASSDTELKLDSIEIFRAVSTVVQNTFDEPKQFSVTLDKQPFLEHGFTIYKARFAADGKGQSSGLRIIYCLGKERVILFTCVAFKNAVENEAKFEAEAIWRIGQFLEFNGLRKETEKTK